MPKTYKVRLEAQLELGDKADIRMAASQALAQVGIYLIKEGEKPELHDIIDVPRGKAVYIIEVDK